MIRVDVLNSQGNLSWSAVFETQELADAWISQEVSKNSWGKAERWLPADFVTGLVYDEDINTAIDSRIVIDVEAQDAILDEEDNVIQEAVEERSHTEYLFAVEYTVNQTDITEQASLESATQQALKNQQIGAYVIARVAAINEQKLIAGSMTQQQFSALLSDQTFANIERLLWNGSLVTAKALISSLDDTYYTVEEKSNILALIP